MHSCVQKEMLKLAAFTRVKQLGIFSTNEWVWSRDNFSTAGAKPENFQRCGGNGVTGCYLDVTVGKEEKGPASPAVHVQGVCHHLLEVFPPSTNLTRLGGAAQQRWQEGALAGRCRLLAYELLRSQGQPVVQ